MEKIDWRGVLKFCPSKDECRQREIYAEGWSKHITKDVSERIKINERISFYADAFAENLPIEYGMKAFTKTMLEVGRLFEDNEDIIVSYFKPEENGSIRPMFEVKNLKMIEENKKKTKNE